MRVYKQGEYFGLIKNNMREGLGYIFTSYKGF